MRQVFVHVNHRAEHDSEAQPYGRGYRQVDRSHSAHPLFKIEFVGGHPRNLRISSLYKLIESQASLVQDTLETYFGFTSARGRNARFLDSTGNGRDVVRATAALIQVEMENGSEIEVNRGEGRERRIFWRTVMFPMPLGGEGAELGSFEVVRQRPMFLPFRHEFVVAELRALAFQSGD